MKLDIVYTISWLTARSASIFYKYKFLSISHNAKITQLGGGGGEKSE